MSVFFFILNMAILFLALKQKNITRKVLLLSVGSLSIFVGATVSSFYGDILLAIVCLLYAFIFMVVIMRLLTVEMFNVLYTEDSEK